MDSQTPIASNLTPPPIPNSGFTQETNGLTGRTILKLFYVLILTGLFLAGGYWAARKFIFRSGSRGSGDTLLAVKYQPVVWKDFGEVFEPLVKIPVYYPGSGYNDEEFLLDSGALVSSLPREKARQMGYTLSQLPRSTFAGFGGTTSFAYKGNIKVKLGDQEVTIPCVFTEAEGTKHILGRSGFFENYSIYFNSKDQVIEIRK